MLFLDKKDRIDLRTIKDYNGNDEVILLLKEKYIELLQIGFPIKFKSDKMSKGNRPGKAQLSIPLTESIKTKKGGSRFLTWCEQTTGKDFDMKFEPARLEYTKTLFLGEEDSEKALYIAATWSHIKNGTVRIDNPKTENREIAKAREKGSALHFYLYNENSPIIDDREMLEKISAALGYGNADMATNEMLRNVIFDRVTASEKANDPEYGLDWFNKAVKGSASLDILAIIQDAQDERILGYNEKSFKWVILDGQGKEVKTLCQVEPAKSTLRKNVLATYLSSHPEDIEILSMAVAGAKERTVAEPKTPIPTVTQDMDFTKLTRFEKIRLAKSKGCKDVQKMKDVELLAWLTENRKQVLESASD